MFGSDLRVAYEAAKHAASTFDADALSGADAREAVRLCVEIERAAASCRLAATRRVEETGAYVESGHRDAAAWTAATVGVTKPEASSMLATARRLESLPETAGALASGSISPTQASYIARAGEAVPGSESRLLNVAREQSVSVLGEECRRLQSSRSAAAEAEAHEQRRKERRCDIRVAKNGNVNVWAVLLPEEGARFMTAHKRQRDLVFRAAQRSGRRESYSQYDADALVALLDAGAGKPGKGDKGSSGKGDKATVNVIVDHTALVRGHREAGETCEIVGVGEVPVAQVKSMMSDCFLRTLVVKGSDVMAATSATRTIPAPVQAALVVRDQHCAVPGCDERDHLEVDHIVPFAEGGPSELANLVRMCRWHHRLKTYKGFRLTGKPGEWKWEPPDRGGG